MIYRLCKRFTVESGHMLHRHPDRCRFPHGHTRTIEVVVASDRLNEFGMVVDFKALKLAVRPLIDQFDHAMAIHVDDPLRPAIEAVYPESLLLYEGHDPTTEVIAAQLFDAIAAILRDGATVHDGPIPYAIPPGEAWLERLRVWETPESWAEVTDSTLPPANP